MNRHTEVNKNGIWIPALVSIKIVLLIFIIRNMTFKIEITHKWNRLLLLIVKCY